MKLLYMERGKNRRKNCFHVFFVTLLLVFVSCKSNSYLNLLTGGSIRYWQLVSVSAMLVDTRQKNIAQAFILERYFFVSICPAAIPGTCLSVFLAAVLLLC